MNTLFINVFVDLISCCNIIFTSLAEENRSTCCHGNPRSLIIIHIYLFMIITKYHILLLCVFYSNYVFAQFGQTASDVGAEVTVQR